MSTPPLAIYGGPPAVTEAYRERWKCVRLRDLAALSWYVGRGINTMPSGGGPVDRFERRFAARTRARYALLMNSGTATLHSAFFAIGVKPGDEVIVPPYTFFASAAPVLHLGGVPVFCDIDERTLTADPNDVEHRITARTKAICVVHVWGNPARVDRLVEIARRHRVALIEDCSHAHGALYRGRSVGTWGDIGCFSLQGNKPVSGGEAGVAITDDATYFDRMLALAHNGRTRQQAAGTFHIDDVSLGLKNRPHIAAAQWALGSLARLDELNSRRARNYRILSEALTDTKAVTPIETYPDAIRGGYFEFVFRYDPEHAGQWPVGSFSRAARAEGVPIGVDRYTRQGQRASLLDEAPLFASMDFDALGGYLGGPTGGRPIDGAGAGRPVAEQLNDQLITLPPLTDVSETFIRQCGAALKKVAEGAARIRDPRTGR